jgi:NAD(P)H-dependent flavin oxidoreductase YrpB (nitropropane dioxygenase family)
MGQGAGAIHEILPCAEIIKRMTADAEKIIDRMGRLRQHA